MVDRSANRPADGPIGDALNRSVSQPVPVNQSASKSTNRFARKSENRSTCHRTCTGFVLRLGPRRKHSVHRYGDLHRFVETDKEPEMHANPHAITVQILESSIEVIHQGPSSVRVETCTRKKKFREIKQHLRDGQNHSRSDHIPDDADKTACLLYTSPSPRD